MIVVDETEYFSSLIGDIYDASLNPTLWCDVLAKIKCFVGGQAASLAWKDAVAKRGDSFYDDGGVAPQFRQLYFEKYIKFDPCTTGQFFSEIGQPISTADVIPYHEFLETRFYQEWARPQGLVDVIMSVLDRSATSMAFCGIFLHERHGLADDDKRRRMRLIVPHVRRAVLIGKLLDHATGEIAAFADTLDGINAGMFLVDAEGRLAHANVAGHKMLSEGGMLRAVGPRLVSIDPQVDLSMREAFAAASSGDVNIGANGIALPLAGANGDNYVAHILPLAAGARRQAGASYAAAAAVFVHKASLSTPSPPEVIAKSYNLTPTELRVLLSVVEVGGVPEVAEVLGIAESTVKTHLKRLYVKTGARRQADLVKIVGKFASPLSP
jgi:DNA-binding CsgD family transcriptional regulator